ncbi:uncharacterized protein LOC122366077 isoform X2 [Amphibalanus amphitrite]|uniref:uncharacterized protein LOC122366077 isoform X2 n=1 Tax=Amphibalanus amphitrite TaxID=1232801 RepID=UPI001C9178DF|nr:uncharacterized protein LOC122366077 isoform X2 [Amphibalanus amphitrite]
MTAIMARFDCPAYKLLAGDLHGSQPVESSGGQLVESSEWRLAGGGAPRQLRLVWLQGELRNVSADYDSAALVDTSGSVLLTGCTAAPGDPHWMEDGRYCMAVGELTCGSPPQLSVIKLAPLPEVHRQMWELEVRHARAHLLQGAAE